MNTRDLVGRKLFLWVVVFVALSMVGCGAPQVASEPTAQPVVEPTAQVAVEPTEAEAAPTVAVEPTAEAVVEPTIEVAPVKLKVAVLFARKIRGSAWDENTFWGLEALKTTLGAETGYTENVQNADIENVLLEYADQGYNLIIGNGFQFGDPMKNVSPRYPDSVFVAVTGNVVGENVGAIDFAQHELGYVLGYVAGTMTKSGKVGFVGNVSSASVIRYSEGFKLGVKAANPDASATVVWTNSYTDAQKARESALALIEGGADVIGHKLAALGQVVIQVAKEKNVWAVGDGAGQIELAPDIVLTTGLTDMPTLMLEVAKEVQAGTYKGEVTTPGFAKGAVSMGPLNASIPTDKVAAIEQVIEDIKSGKLVVPAITQETN